MERPFLFQVSSFRFRVSSFEFQVSSFEFRVSGFEFRVSSFEFQVSGLSLAFSTHNPKLETQNSMHLKLFYQLRIFRHYPIRRRLRSCFGNDFNMWLILAG